ncbi:DUF317 domain-containing protein [Streptomyces sp. NPDC058545]|uniref:DUF317 domain-containing protein n=1 Tax=Streptomyces sp. NPDC058545 TaxID=3346544 RepID=UPI0036509D4D
MAGAEPVLGAVCPWAASFGADVPLDLVACFADALSSTAPVPRRTLPESMRQRLPRASAGRGPSRPRRPPTLMKLGRPDSEWPSFMRSGLPFTARGEHASSRGVRNPEHRRGLLRGSTLAPQLHVTPKEMSQ